MNKLLPLLGIIDRSKLTPSTAKLLLGMFSLSYPDDKISELVDAFKTQGFAAILPHLGEFSKVEDAPPPLVISCPKCHSLISVGNYE